jgi:hypothetical protein
MIPPRPAVIAHGKVLPEKQPPLNCFSRGCLPVCTSRPLGFAILRVGVAQDVSRMRWARARPGNPAWRHSDKELPSPYCYGFRTANRLVRRRLRAHRRRFARSPRFRYRAGLKIVGAADDLRNTLCRKTRNEIDSHLRRLKT